MASHLKDAARTRFSRTAQHKRKCEESSSMDSSTDMAATLESTRSNDKDEPKKNKGRRSSFSRLSQSITGSLRIKKKRNVSVQPDDSGARTIICSPSVAGGNFNNLNKSVACMKESSARSPADGSTSFTYHRRRSLRKTSRSYNLHDNDVSVHASDSLQDLTNKETWTGSSSLRLPGRYTDCPLPPKIRKVAPCNSFSTRPEPEGAEDNPAESTMKLESVTSGQDIQIKAQSMNSYQMDVSSPSPDNDLFYERFNRSELVTFSRSFPCPTKCPTTDKEETHQNSSVVFFDYSSTLGNQSLQCILGDNSVNESTSSYLTDIHNSNLYSVMESDQEETSSSSGKSLFMAPISDGLNVTVSTGYNIRRASDVSTERIYGRRYWKQQKHNHTFTQGLSLAVGEDPSSSSSNHKLITACSVNNIACQTGDQRQLEKAGRVASWAVNFDNLLKDPIGIGIFTEFLKKEFSEENIIFWKACEQYRQLADEQQRKTQAKDIYSRYLSTKASDPVNVDSAARSYTERFLDNPTAIMFDVAQQQIFQLMRQDSYARFLKSELYKTKLVEEMEGKPLENPVEENDAQVDGKEDKKKGKGKENDEKRWRSILPWRTNRKSLKSTSDPELKKLGKKGKEEKEKEKEPNNNNNNSNNNPSVSFTSVSSVTTVTTISSNSNFKKPPGPGIDLSTMRKEVFQKDFRDAPESHFKFCRIVMPDGSTTVVCAKPGQTSRTVLGKLCEKRSISIASVDVFLLGSDRPLDLNEDISTLGSKEIVIERRVLFRLDLPNGKSIGVKAKPNRSIRDVFKPILNKYGYCMENIAVHLVGSQEFIDLDVAVSELDNQRAVILSHTDATEMAWQGSQPMSSRPPKAPLTSRSKGGQSGHRGGSLEEITNKIFEDLMRGKSQLAHGFDELGVLELDKAKAHRNEEGRSLGLFGLLRKESWGGKDNNKGSKSKGKVTFALPRNDSKKKGNTKEGERLFEMLSSAQNMRLEEQRGVVVSTGELPSFLCQEDGKTDQKEKESAVEEVHLNNEDTKSTGGNMFDDVAEISKAGFLEKKSKRKDTTDFQMTPSVSAGTPRDAKRFNMTTPLSEKWKSNTDRSFSQDGIVPSPEEAEAYFRMSPVVVDARNHLVTQSLDGPFLNGGRPLKSMDEGIYEEPDMNVGTSDSIQFNGSPAFTPRYISSLHGGKAPVASPETFSHENKNLNYSPETKKSSVVVSSLLPNKISPGTRSSSTSSNMSSSNTHGNSPTATHQPTTSSFQPAFSAGTPRRSPTNATPRPQSLSPTKNINRLSDTVLVQKLQQAQRQRDNSTPDKETSGQANHRPTNNNFNNVGHNSTSPTQYLTHPNPKNNQGVLETKTEFEDHSDLAQRALLSPRFDQSPQKRSRIQTTLNISPSFDTTSRALLSPQFDQKPSYRDREPPPYQKRNSPLTTSPSNMSHAALLSPRYTQSPSSFQLSSQPRRLSTQANYSNSSMSPRNVPYHELPGNRDRTSQSMSSFSQPMPQSSFSQAMNPTLMSQPPPYKNITSSRYTPLYHSEPEEGAVTFV